MKTRLLLCTMVLAGSALGCLRSPSPLVPSAEGSIGLPHRGALVNAAKIPAEGPHVKRLRGDDRAFAVPRLLEAVDRAAAEVMTQKRGEKLVVGDFSREHGGVLLPHLSHRSGRDGDLLLYYTTLDGAPVEAPGFIHVEADGLAWDEAHARFLRFDVEREWWFVRALLSDESARIQWIFANHNVRALLLEWARARGESDELLSRAALALAEPKPGGLHDDHLHVRTACTDEELVSGCEASGPKRAWIPERREWADEDAYLLALELMRPLASSMVATR